jgi:transcriptional regulator with XRE-family HTH domain
MSIHQSVPISAGSKIGRYTKYQREKRGFSLNYFAKITGLTTSFFLRLEKGEYASISISAIEKIARGFDMTIGDFLHKCQIIESSHTLPPLEYYLKEKYQFPDDAIKDFKLLVRLLRVKYKKEISELKNIHEAYWDKSTKNEKAKK